MENLKNYLVLLKDKCNVGEPEQGTEIVKQLITFTNRHQLHWNIGRYHYESKINIENNCIKNTVLVNKDHIIITFSNDKDVLYILGKSIMNDLLECINIHTTTGNECSLWASNIVKEIQLL